MDNQTLFEIIGYLASAVIAISLLMKSLIRLRILNAAGSLVFVIYGILIKAYPVAVMNAAIVIINIYYLVQMLNRNEYFSIMEVSPDSEYLSHFINFHLDDIRHFFPEFSYKSNKSYLVFFVLRNTIPAGLVILDKYDDKGSVLLDYALKDFRDFKIGSFIFDDNANMLINHGIKYLEAESVVENHVRYLKEMGFVRKDENLYIKKLPSQYIQDADI